MLSDDDTGEDIVVPEPDWFRRDEEFRTILPRQADRTKLAKGGITDVDSLLRHFPRRWVDPGQFTDIRALGTLEEGTDVVLHVTVADVASRRMKNRRGTISTVSVTDSAGGFVDVVFFNQPWIGRVLTAETRILVSARIKYYRGRVQLSSPTLLTGDGRIADDERTGRHLDALTFPAGTGLSHGRQGDEHADAHSHHDGARHGLRRMVRGHDPRTPATRAEPRRPAGGL